MQVRSTVKLNMARIQELTAASVRALEKTAEALHTEVVQVRVFPRDTGHLQNEATFVDYSESSQGKVTLVSATPYARRLYYHPEYNFHKEPWEEEWVDKDGKRHHLKHDGNPNARGEWYEDWLPGGSKVDFAVKAFKKSFKEESGV